MTTDRSGGLDRESNVSPTILGVAVMLDPDSNLEALSGRGKTLLGSLWNEPA